MRSDDDDILGPLARSAAPDLDDGTRERIEAGLRVHHVARADSRRAPARARWMVAAPALVVLLIVSIVVMVARDESAVSALEVRDASDVVITLPSGDRIADPADGFALIEGALVVVGDRGTITIDDVVLGAGAVVTVRDGQLVSDVVATTTTHRSETVDGRPEVIDPPSDTRPSIPVVPTRPTVTSSPDIGPDPVDPPPPSTTQVDDRPPPAPTDSPPAPGPDQDRPDDPAPDSGPVDDVGLAVALRVRSTGGRIEVTWNTEGVEEGWRVMVLRTVDGSSPDTPDRATVVGEGPSGEISEVRADLPDVVVALRYRVVVVDPGGGVVARSEVQTLRRPDS